MSKFFMYACSSMLSSLWKTCFKCEGFGHLSKYCRKTNQMAINSVLATLKENGRKLCGANVLAPSVIDIEINGKQIRSLLDTVASECFMTPKLAKELNLKIDRKSNDRLHSRIKRINQM